MHEENITQSFFNVEKQFKNLQKRKSELESENNELKQKLSVLTVDMHVNQLKLHIYEDIITSMTNIKLTDFIKKVDNEYHIHNSETYDASIIVHNFFNNKKGESEDKKYSIRPKKQQHKKKELFRAINNAQPEKPTEVESKLQNGEKKIAKIINTNFDISVTDVLSQIEQDFKELSLSFVTKNIQQIQKSRFKLFGKYNFEEYMDLLEEHISQFKNIVKTRHESPNAYEQYIQHFLTPLEQRLVCSKGYYLTQLDQDQISKYRNALQIHNNHPKRYIPCSLSQICEKLSNYSMAIFSLSENFKRVLVNPYGFHSVVYVEQEKNSGDPFAFYMLDSSDDNVNKWKIEYRLYEFAKFIAPIIKEYCITLFRKIYYDVFSDNIYREDYQTKAVIMKLDCKQLLMNIKSLCHIKSLCLMLQNIIMDNCKLSPTNNDKFNFRNDDKLIKKSFTEDTTNDYQSIIKRLFEQIDQDQIEKFMEEEDEF